MLASGMWTIAFFSLSSCKLPTYILPALPMLCLAIGRAVAAAFWLSPQRSSVTTRMRLKIAGVTDLATLLAILGVPIGFLVVACFEGTLTVPYSLLLLSLCCFACLSLFGWFYQRVVTQHHRIAIGVIITLLVGGFLFIHVVPRIAVWRSSLIQAAKAQDALGDETPIVFFGRHRDWARYRVGDATVIEFRSDQVREMQEYVSRRRQSILVGSGSAMRNLHASPRKIRLRRWGGSSRHRNIYVARPLYKRLR